MNPFEMTFRFIETFQGSPSIDGRPPWRPLVLLGDGAPLLESHKNLGAAMERNGLRPARYFTPHMTLLYGPVPIPAQPIEQIWCMVNEFALVHSKLWLTQYDVIERWSLQG